MKLKEVLKKVLDKNVTFVDGNDIRITVKVTDIRLTRTMNGVIINDQFAISKENIPELVNEINPLVKI